MTPTPDTTARNETAETVTVPRRMVLTHGALLDLNFICGTVDDTIQKDDVVGELWIGEITDDDGSKRYGLNATNSELPEEGSVQIVALASPQHPSGVRAIRTLKPIGEEAEQYRAARGPEWCKIFDTLRDYRMSNMADEDGEPGYPLVDLMSRDGAGVTIDDGEWEMAALADEIGLALSHPPAQDAPGAVKVLEEAAANAAMYLASGFIPCPACGYEVSTAETDAEQELRSALMLIAKTDETGLPFHTPFEMQKVATDALSKSSRVRQPASLTGSEMWEILYGVLHETAHDISEDQCERLARAILAALDPSPPLPEADGEVVADDPSLWRFWNAKALDLATRLDAERAELAELREEIRQDSKLIGGHVCKSLLERAETAEAALVSALRERDEARVLAARRLELIRTERAFREKAEQVAAGLREDGARLDWLERNSNAELKWEGWEEDVWQVYTVNGGRNDREWTLRAEGNSVREAIDAARAALRASTEEGKTATPSVTEEEAGRG